MTYKLGSLFDGSGGFPLAGCLCNIEPRWAAEVEPYPIAVTRTHFPNMIHLGDISKVNGGEIEPVDIITFGSPCQDLSVAGKRAGLKHEANGDDETTRSGLFMEAVRIIKEMRAATDNKFPRFALWENVPGAFSSQKGEDFRVVLEELIRIVEPRAVMPTVPKAGWAYADSYTGDGWSLAYRVFDAQYWGVPQRRRRIHLVLDLRGECAGEVLFEREGVRGYFAESRTPWQGIAEDAQGGIGADDREGECNARAEGTGGAGGAGGLDAVAYTLKIRSGCAVDSGGKAAGKGALIQTDKAATLSTVQDQYLFQPMHQTAIMDNIGGQAEYGKVTNVNGTLRAGGQGLVCYPTAFSFDSLASNSMKSKNPHSGCRAVEVAKTLDTSDPNPSKNQGGIAVVEDVTTIGLNGENRVSPTLISRMSSAVGTTQDNLILCEPIPIHDQATRFSGKRGDKSDGKGNGLGVGNSGDPMNTLTAGDRHAMAYRQGSFADYVEGEVGTLKASGGDLGGGSENLIVSYPPRYIVRRLTPTECARLQGFADRWGDIEEKTSFTPEEFEFWHEVRNTHAAINGKKVQEYTEMQMLTWYNKLHTDSAEYKMWGNGIALPPALYILQGMMDAFVLAENKTEDLEDWML